MRVWGLLGSLSHSIQINVIMMKYRPHVLPIKIFGCGKTCACMHGSTPRRPSPREGRRRVVLSMAPKSVEEIVMSTSRVAGGQCYRHSNVEISRTRHT
jgi:hypothetical protein